MKKIFLIFLPVLAFAAEPKLGKYIGMLESALDKLPEVSKNSDDTSGNQTDDQHAQLIKKINNKLVVLFGAYTGKSNPRDVRITDAMDYPANSKTENLVVGCSLNKVADPEIMAVVKVDSKLEVYVAIKAWRMNSKTGKFEKIDTKNITCLNESYGV